MNVERLYYKDEKGVFRKLPDMALISANTEAKMAIEGISQFVERHLGFGDSQYPDVNMEAIDAILKMNMDFKATHIWVMGDMLNATTLSKFGYPSDYHISFWDEIRGTRELLKHITTEARKANPDVIFNYLEGNHENRFQKYIDKNAPELGELEDSKGERVLGLPSLLNLNELKINWTPYWEDNQLTQDVTILHGNLARIKSGYTAQAYLDKYGQSTIAGHDHRLALIFRTQSGNMKFGIETGSTCQRKMLVPYTRENQTDWQEGAFIVGIDKDGDGFPGVMPIVNGKLAFGLNVYSGAKHE